jgi:amino-acid N-acetyltransferase
MQIEPLAPYRIDDARALLRANDLPVDDLLDPTVQLFGATLDGALVGVIGLQRCGDAALLRSLVTTEAARSRGVAKQLCEHVFAVARAAGLDTLYLLTTSASAYFTRHGFVTIDRAATPSAIRETAQFASLCPASATVMTRPLP